MTECTFNRKLCRLVESYPCLYDKSVPEFSNNKCVRRAWVDIGRVLNQTARTVRVRWGKLLNSYNHFLEPGKDCDVTRSRRKFYLYDELEFLRNPSAFSTSNLPIRISTLEELDKHHENSQQSTEKCNDTGMVQVTADPSPAPSSSQREEVNLSPSSSPSQREEVNPSPSSSQIQREEKQRPSLQADDDIKAVGSPVKKRARIDSRNDPGDSLMFTDLKSRNHDVIFLQNLLPDMEILNAKQKIIFKKKIYESLEEVLNEAKDYPETVKPIVSNISALNTMNGGKKSTKSVGSFRSIASSMQTSLLQKETQTDTDEDEHEQSVERILTAIKSETIGLNSIK